MLPFPFSFHSLCKGHKEDKGLKGVLPSVTKSLGFTLMKLPHPQSDTTHMLQAKEIRHCHSGRESQISMTPQEALAIRPSQSAPL